jgi:hypothetical protein
MTGEDSLVARCSTNAGYPARRIPMNNAMALSLMALFCAAGPALAQQQATPGAAQPAAAQPAAPSAKAAHPTAQSEAGEPRADTSNGPVTGPAPSTTPSVAPAPSAATAPTPSTAGAPAARGSAGQKPAPRTDRLELGTATVTGEREQPKVMYVVPWKRSDIGDLTGKPMNSLVDEILAPVDRDVFKREVVYYNAVQADASQNGAPPKPAQQGEK